MSENGTTFSTMVCGHEYSGRTTLVGSFLKKWAWHDKVDADFYYDIDSSPEILAKNPFDYSTLDRHMLSSVNIARRPKTNTLRQKLSAHQHRLWIGEFTDVHQGDDFQNVLVCLPAEPAPVDYQFHLEQVINSFPNYSVGILGICLTMVDRGQTENVRFMDEKSVKRWIRSIYGQAVLDLLETSRRRNRTAYFATSSAGYQDRDPSKRSNHDAASGHLKHPDIWRPWNVAAPFFSLMENSETLKISRSGQDRQINLASYLKYPSAMW